MFCFVPPKLLLLKREFWIGLNIKKCVLETILIIQSVIFQVIFEEKILVIFLLPASHVRVLIFVSKILN